MRAAALLLAALSANGQLITRSVPAAEAIERGQKAFVTACGFCHGASAKGGESGPDLVRSPVVLDDENGDQIGPVILKGRPGKGMPQFSMTAAQISDIAAFLRSRSQATINRREYKIQDLVTGDAKAGLSFFNGAGKCNTCHSPTGDLAGIGRKYEPVALQDQFLYPARGGQKKQSEVTVTLPSGQTATGILLFIDDFNIMLRDADGYSHSWSVAGAKIDLHDPYAAHADLLKRYTDADMHNILAYLVTLK